MHRPHGDVHTEGLADDCGGCGELAEKPLANLDETMLRELVEQAAARAGVRSITRREPRSLNELVAETDVLNALERAGRIAEVAPDVLALYLRDRWRLDAAISNPMQPAVDAMRERIEREWSP